MVLCKYFQQGNCRYGQYCKFEHSFGNRSKTFNDDKNFALLVAEEVRQAERGGQWLLSCYGPFKERKCIPGMDDVSPEEVRWEMYQAQKTGTADQVNAQFQQMCEQMKAKREALKNPTPAIYQMLEEISNSGTDSANKGNFAFGASQLGTSNTNQSSSVFGQKTAFGATSNNPFGSTSSFNSNQQAASIFGRSSTTAPSNVFGVKASFGSTSVFGSSSTANNSIFGGANKPASATFGSVPSTSTFGNQGNTIFGGSSTSQTAFGQPPAFGASTQVNNPLFKPQTAQTSVFGGAATSMSSSVFGGSAPSTATNSVFGTQAAAPAASNAQTGTSIFGQTTAAASAFGGGPVFGGTSAFGAQNPASASVFGGQSTFGQASAAPAATNVFGGVTAGTSGFETLAQSTNTNAFGAPANASPFGASTSSAVVPNASPFGAAAGTTAVAPNAFGAATSVAVAPNASPFGAATSAAVAPNASPFGAATATAAAPNASPFGTATPTTVAPNTSPFGAATSIAGAGPFGATTGTSVFGTTASSSASPLMGTGFAAQPAATTMTSTTNVFGTPASASTSQTAFGGSAFGGTQTSTSSNVFGTATTAQPSGNPFLANIGSSSPFGPGTTTHSSPFGKVPDHTQTRKSLFGSFSYLIPIIKQLIKESKSETSFQLIVDYVEGFGLTFDDGMTLLHLAVAGNNLGFIKYLLDHGFDVDAKNSFNDTPLLIAVRSNYVNATRILLDADADVRATDPSSGRTTLEILLSMPWKRDIIPNFMGNLRRSNLNAATLAELLVLAVLTIGDAEVSRNFLLRNPTGNYQSAMELAMKRLDINNIHLIFRYGNNTGREVFYRKLSGLFVKKNMESLNVFIKILMSNWDLVSKEALTKFTFMFYSADIEYMQVLLDCGIDERVREKFGIDLRVYIFGNQLVDAVELLRYKDFNVNATGIEKETALHFSVRKENLTSNVRFLLDSGADVNMKNSLGRTALFYCIAYKSIESCQLLLEFGADVQIYVDVGYWITLFQLAQITNSDFVELLVAQLAISHVKGVPIKETIQNEIDGRENYKNAFDARCQELQLLKTSEVVSCITYYAVLNGRIETLYRVIRDKDTVSSLDQYKNQHELHSLYYSTIKNKLKQISNLYRFSCYMSDFISETLGKFVHFDHLIIETIFKYLSNYDIQVFLKSMT